jgi:hypothetical protein
LSGANIAKLGCTPFHPLSATLSLESLQLPPAIQAHFYSSVELKVLQTGFITFIHYQLFFPLESLQLLPAIPAQL